MRNLAEYPLTADEALEILTKAHLDLLEDKLIGDMRPYALSSIVQFVTANKASFTNWLKFRDSKLYPQPGDQETSHQRENERHIHYRLWLQSRSVQDSFDPSEMKYLSNLEIEKSLEAVDYFRQFSSTLKFVHAPTFTDYIDGEQHLFIIERFKAEDVPKYMEAVTSSNTIYFLCAMVDKTTGDVYYRMKIN